jgi:hypothetical protein
MQNQHLLQEENRKHLQEINNMMKNNGKDQQQLTELTAQLKEANGNTYCIKHIANS